MHQQLTRIAPGVNYLNNTEPEQSTMFLSDLTVVDHAYIDSNGHLIGGSINPSFLIGGQPDPIEKVVVDFSAVKKDVKRLIDQHVFDVNDNGFDHKLWILDGYSNYLSVDFVYYNDTLVVNIETPALSITMPADAVKIFKATEYSTEAIESVMGEFVQRKLSDIHPKVGIMVKCTVTTNCHIPTAVQLDEYPTSDFVHVMFRYAHGLKDSTSYGCQNIAHGHLSYIGAKPGTLDVMQALAVESTLIDIAADVDQAVFVRNSNISQDPNLGEVLTVKYTTGRGSFYLGVKSECTQKVIVLPTETTVEFLAEFIASTYANELARVGITELYVSEGLSKGAVVVLPH